MKSTCPELATAHSSIQRIDVHKLADEAKLNSFHWSLLIWCFVILVLDGYDLAVVGIAIPSIMEAMNVDGTTAGFMASSALFGMMFGAIGLGSLADKIGRRWALAICVFLFSGFTMAAGFTNDPITFSVVRFFAGLGIGGALPLLAAQMSDYAPKKVRSVMITLVGCGYAVGSFLAALLGKQFIETYGWQSVFIAAGAPIVLIPFVLKYIPESLSFLLKKHDDMYLREVVRKIRPDMRIEPHVKFLVPEEDKAEGSTVGRLFLEGRGFSTVMLWVAFIACMFLLYSLSSWLVKLMGMAGYNLGSALNFLLVYNTGALVGTIGGGWLADKLNIKWVTCAFFAVAAVSLTLLGYGAQPLFLIVAVVGASTLGTQLLLYAYAGQFYPTSIRSTGLGFASGLGRIGAFTAPVVIGLLVSMNLPLEQNFVAIAMAAVIGGVAVALIKHKSSASSHSHEASAVEQRP